MTGRRSSRRIDAALFSCLLLLFTPACADEPMGHSAQALQSAPAALAAPAASHQTLSIWEINGLEVPLIEPAEGGDERPFPVTDPAPCDDDLSCECVLDTCLDLPVPVSFACDSLGWEPECIGAVLGAYEQEGGCGVPCQGFTLPGLDAICTAPACDSVRSIVTGFIGQDVCDVGCACEPQCDGKSCGPDACGGTCGHCDGIESCEAGQCVEPDCSAGINCPCMIDACVPGLPVSATSVCDMLADSPACLDIALEVWEATSSCEGSCTAIKLPGAKQMCDMPECGSILDLMGMFGDPCACHCEPSCEGKACGADGCGGSCGSCGDASVCLDDQCHEVDGVSCEGGVDFECAVEACGGIPELDDNIPAELVTDMVESAPDCRDAMMAAWLADGCAPQCGSVGLPGVEALCAEPACEYALSAAAYFYQEDFCDACASE